MKAIKDIAVSEKGVLTFNFADGAQRVLDSEYESPRVYDATSHIVLALAGALLAASDRIAALEAIKNG
jgi:hypothetical protein